MGKRQPRNLLNFYKWVPAYSVYLKLRGPQIWSNVFNLHTDIRL